MILRRDYKEQYHRFIIEYTMINTKNLILKEEDMKQKKKIMNEMFLHLRCEN